METIRIYLENMFSNLPKDERLARVKSDLLCTMEDKYSELKAEGKSENEAVGAVISDFGNIDELLDEMGIKKEAPAKAETAETAEGAKLLFLDEQATDDYLTATRKFSLRVAIGVMLCILSPAILGICNRISSLSTGAVAGVFGTLGMPAMMSMITAAVVLFIVNGISYEKYSNYDKCIVSVPENVREKVSAKSERYIPRFAACISIGVALCILSFVIPSKFNRLLWDGGIMEAIFGSGWLVFIAVGVFLFIRAGITKGSYDIVLGKNNDRVRDLGAKYDGSSQNKAVQIFSGILWPVAVSFFLISGICFHCWHPTWLVFPIAGLLEGAFAAVAGAVSKK